MPTALIGAPPDQLTWSPDGKHLTYLDGGELMDLDPATGKAHVLVSAAKMAALTRVDDTEQDRDHRERYKMASYMWAPDSKHLLFDSGGRLWLYDLRNGTGSRSDSRARCPATIPSSLPTASTSRLSAITVWPGHPAARAGHARYCSRSGAQSFCR